MYRVHTISTEVLILKLDFDSGTLFKTALLNQVIKQEPAKGAHCVSVDIVL